MVQGVDLFFALFNNLAIFVALATAYGFVLRQFKRKPLQHRQLLIGVVFGAFAIGCMYAKIPVFKGVIVDQRNAIVALTAVYGGPLAGFISVVLAGSFRIYLGGSGVFAGLVGLHLAAISGVLLRLIPSPFETPKRAVLSALFSTILILPGFLFVGDFTTGLNLLQAMALPYGLAIFFGILFVGLLLNREEKHIDSEELLARSEQRFRLLVDTIPDPIWLKDSQGVFVTCNTTFEKRFKKTRSEIIGKTDYDLHTPQFADHFRAVDRQVMLGSAPVCSEERIQFADSDKPSFVQITKIPMRDKRGQLIGILGIAHDITDIKDAEEMRLRLETQLNEAQKIESIGILAGGVAHDFNNMLGAIMGHAELALMRKDQEDLVLQHLKDILVAAKRSSSLTTQLMAYARKQTIAPEIQNLNQTTEEMLNMLRSLVGESIQLDFLPSEDLWLVKIDSTQVSQILVNLCSNARDAMDGSGTIEIATENISYSHDHYELGQHIFAGDYIRLRVKDDGCGMDETTKAHIFEPFFTTKDIGKGTGLGLSAVYGAINQNKGFIRIDSQPGSGTSIDLFFPRCFSDEQSRGTEKAKIDSVNQQATILLVEDEEQLLDTISTILKTQGYTVLCSNSSEKALEFARTHHEHINLLLSDIMMPLMNGKDLAHKIKTYQPDIQVLFMSGYSEDMISNDGIIKEGVNFIQKPASGSDLVKKIQEVLDLRVVSS